MNMYNPPHQYKTITATLSLIFLVLSGYDPKWLLATQNLLYVAKRHVKHSMCLKESKAS